MIHYLLRDLIFDNWTATYNFDPNGNTVAKAEGSNFWRYGFDHENQVNSVANRRQTVRYVYDALGRRVRRHIKGSKENTKFTYEGEDVLLDDDVVTGATKYLNGPGIDNKLRQTNGSTTSYFLADHLGSTNGLTNASGAVTASNSYDSFGNPSNASFPTRYQFTGREFDNFSGLQYSRARFYDPNLGHFISEDPIGFAGGDVNLYGYVKNRPVNRKDPSGLFDPGYGADGGIPTPYRHFPASTPCGCNPPGTLQISASGLAIIPPGIAGVLAGGIALDGSGNVGLYSEYGLGGGVGASLSGGINVNASNAPTIDQLAGTFNNFNINGGAGYDAGFNAFASPDFSVGGGGFSFGGGAGAGGSSTQTETIFPGRLNVYDLAGINMPKTVCR